MPTASGEGKTTTSVGLGDGMSRLGKSVAICLREPSLGLMTIACLLQNALQQACRINGIEVPNS